MSAPPTPTNAFMVNVEVLWFESSLRSHDCTINLIHAETAVLLRFLRI